MSLYSKVHYLFRKNRNIESDLKPVPYIFGAKIHTSYRSGTLLVAMPPTEHLINYRSAEHGIISYLIQTPWMCLDMNYNAQYDDISGSLHGILAFLDPSSEQRNLEWDSVLYNPIIPNTRNNGSICLGSGRANYIGKHVSITECISAIVNAFWDSNFNSDLHGERFLELSLRKWEKNPQRYLSERAYSLDRLQRTSMREFVPEGCMFFPPRSIFLEEFMNPSSVAQSCLTGLLPPPKIEGI